MMVNFCWKRIFKIKCENLNSSIIKVAWFKYEFQFVNNSPVLVQNGVGKSNTNLPIHPVYKEDEHILMF